MKLIKKNPNCFFEDAGESLKILNNFSDFVTKMQVSATKSPQFKKNILKVIESLKTIKINLEFIGYAVENKIDSSLYIYETVQKKNKI